MSNWKDITRDSWSFTSDSVTGYGGGIGSYKTSYTVNLENNSLLNGRISADLRIAKRHLTGAGLICRADDLWTFLAMYVTTSDQKDFMAMRIGFWKQGMFNIIVSKKENIYLDDDFNHFSLDFFSGFIKGEITTSVKTYTLEYLAPHIPFPGYVGLVKFYGAGITAKNIKIESRSYPNIALGATKVKTYKYDIFISHSSKDKQIVEKIIQDFRLAGITYWVDHEQINFGDAVTDKIENGLRESKNILVCISSNLGKSNWCRAEYGPILNRELSRSSKPTVNKVIPLRLDDCDDDDIPILLYDRKRADYSNNEEYSELLKFLRI